MQIVVTAALSGRPAQCTRYAVPNSVQTRMSLNDT